MSFNLQTKYKEFNFADGVVSPTDITGLKVDTSISQAYELEYIIERRYTNGITPFNEDTNFEFVLAGLFNNTVTTILKQSTGKYIVIGSFGPNVGSLAVQGNLLLNGVVRFNADWTFDYTFNPGGTGLITQGGVSGAWIQADDKILIVLTVFSSTPTYNGTTVLRIFRLNSDGTLDTTFNTNLGTGPGATNMSVFYPLSDGTIIVAGASGFNTWNGVSRNSLTKLNSDGTENSAFVTNIGTGFSGSISSAVQNAIQISGGVVLIGGTFNKFNGNTRNGIIALNSDGTENSAFQTNLGTGFLNSGGSLIVSAMVQDPNNSNKILIGGGYSSFNGNTRNSLIRLNSDGTEDTTFYTNFGGFVDGGTGIFSNKYSITVQPDSKILISGLWQIASPVQRGLARLNSDGTFDSAFNAFFQPGFAASNVGANRGGTGAVIYDSTYGIFVVSVAVVSLNNVTKSSPVYLFPVSNKDYYVNYIQTSSGNISQAGLRDGVQVSYGDGTTTNLGIVITKTASGQYQYTSNTPAGSKVYSRIRWYLRTT